MSLRLLTFAALLLPFIIAQSTCSPGTKCPASAPCCSEYGFCGTGTYCQQGCEPLWSNTLTSCRPNPICQSFSTNFPANLDRLQLNATKFNGNASMYDWVVNSGYIVPTSDGIRLTLNKSNTGTKISSTRYIHYGQIDFTMEVSKWQGVVSAAITMSDVKDEIDWEWTGTSNTQAQTNVWFLGIANYTNSLGTTVNAPSDTSANFLTYTLLWQPDQLTWMINGNTVRTLSRQETFDSVNNRYAYPSTPSRIQLSIWPGGVYTNAPGTIQWAGGYIQYNEPEYVQNGYYWNTVKSITVKCNPDAGQTQSTTGWVYTGNSSVNIPIVAVTNASTLLSASSRTVQSPFSILGAGAIGMMIIISACLLV